MCFMHNCIYIEVIKYSAFIYKYICLQRKHNYLCTLMNYAIVKYEGL